MQDNRTHSQPLARPPKGLIPHFQPSSFTIEFVDNRIGAGKDSQRLDFVPHGKKFTIS